MRQVKIEHPLRTILLEYDDSKPESDYEKELVEAYIDMHDKTAALKTRKGKLAYEYKLLEEEVEQAEIKMAPISTTLSNFLIEAKAHAQQEKKSDEALKDFDARVHSHYEEAIAPFHQSIEAMGKTCDALQKEYEEFDDDVEKHMEEFDKYHSEVSGKLYKNHDDYSLDLCSYDDDEQELCGVLDELQFFYKEHSRFIDRYNALMAETRKAYAELHDAQSIMNEFYADSGMLNDSLSVNCGKGLVEKEKQPKYLLPPGDKRVVDFKVIYGKLAKKDTKTITIDVPIDVVKAGEVLMLQELIMMLQHYPGMIEKWIFAVEIEFLNRDEIVMPEDEWKGHHPPMRWFHKLNSLPIAIFFIQDHDARAYMLMGDLVADGKLSGQGEDDPKQQAVYVEGEMLQEIQNRLYTSCLFFLLYSHNTGFDPQPYIEAIMSDFEAVFTYEDVLKEHEENIKNNIQLRVVPMKDGEELKG